MEEWRAIEGYEGKYEVSNTGKVRNLNYRNQGRTREFKKSLNDWGYEFVHIYSNGHTKKHMVNVLVARAFIPNPENKPQVNHKDGNKRNNCVSNLEWATQSENMLHAYKTGLSEKTREGARERGKELAKHLSESRKVPIKAIHIETGAEKEYASIKEACEELGVSQWNVYAVTQGKRKHTKGYTFEKLRG